jgi:hypothetical protein
MLYCQGIQRKLKHATQKMTAYISDLVKLSSSSLCATQSVNNVTNCSFFLTLSLSTQHISALNGHPHVSFFLPLGARAQGELWPPE